MADEPDNLVLRMLREMRGVLKKQIEGWQETTAAGVGLEAL